MILKTLPAETIEQFVARLNADEAFKAQFPAESDRFAVAPEIFRRCNAAGGDALPKKYASPFIEPGLCNYPDMPGVGVSLVRKAALDRGLASMEGKPVRIIHNLTNPENFGAEADGVVTRAWFEPADGWFWAEYYVWGVDAQAICDEADEKRAAGDRTGWGVSCAYQPTAQEPGGDYNGIPYNNEVADLAFDHLALVPNPRFSGADKIFRLNSKPSGGTTPMKNLFRWLAGQKKSEPLDASKAVVKVDGKTVLLSEILANSAPAAAPELELAETDSVELDGETIDLSKRVAQYRANAAAKAAAEKEAADKLAADQRRNADEEKEKKEAKEKEDRENAEAHEKGEHDDEEKQRDNCAMCNSTKAAAARANAGAGAKSFENANDNANKRGEHVSISGISTREDKIKRGLELCGSAPKAS